MNNSHVKHNVYLDVEPIKKKWRLNRIEHFTDRNGKSKAIKGSGSKVLKNLTRAADKYKKIIYLTPEAGSGGVKNIKLEDYYKKHGFKKHGEFMFRNPN